MEPIKIQCTDFSEFGYNNHIFRLLKEHYELEISDTPEVVIYGPFGRDFLRHDCLRIYYTGENTRPNFNECDYAFSFDYSENPRNYRFPDYAAYGFDIAELTRPKKVDAILAKKTRFCCFVYSNPIPQERIRFFRALSRYRRVDSFGRVCNNMPEELGCANRGAPNWQQSKLDRIAPYKFSIAFENESHPGYVTEKILHAMLTHSIPIYWGNTEIHKEFNARSFINCHEYPSFKDTLRRVMEVDGDDRLYRQMLAEPYYHDNQIPENLREGNVLKQLDEILRTRRAVVPVARRNLVSTTEQINASLCYPTSRATRLVRKLEYRYCALRYIALPTLLGT